MKQITMMIGSSAALWALFVLVSPAPVVAQDASGKAGTKPDPTGEAVAAEPAEEKKDDPPVDGRRTALVSRMLLKVINPEDVRTVLEEEAAKIGGFPVLVTDSEIYLKVPPRKLSAMLEIAAKEGMVVEKSLDRKDLTQEIAQLEGQLKSKRKILAKLRSFFDDSNVQATLRIEQTMTDLVTEIERVKGQLRVARDRAQWAVIEISFEFRQRDRIIYVNSPFEWLNTVNLDQFLEEF
jgi:hypothetical protein